MFLGAFESSLHITEFNRAAADEAAWAAPQDIATSQGREAPLCTVSDGSAAPVSLLHPKHRTQYGVLSKANSGQERNSSSFAIKLTTIMMEIFQGTKSRFFKNQSSPPIISETEETGNRNSSSSALVNTNATHCSQQENQKGCAVLKGNSTCGTNCWSPRQQCLSTVHFHNGSHKAHVHERRCRGRPCSGRGQAAVRASTGSTTGPAAPPSRGTQRRSTYKPHDRRLSCRVYRGSGCACAPRAALGRGELCEGQRRLEPGEDERLGSLGCRVVTACSRHAGRGRERGHSTAGCTASLLQRPTAPQLTAPPRRGESRALRNADGGQRMQKQGRSPGKYKELPAQTRRNFRKAVNKTRRCNV